MQVGKVCISRSKISQAFGSGRLSSNINELIEEIKRASAKICGQISIEDINRSIVILGREKHNELLIESCFRMAQVFSEHAEELKQFTNPKTLPRQIMESGMELNYFMLKAQKHTYTFAQLNDLFTCIGESIHHSIIPDSRKEMSTQELNRAQKQQRKLLKKAEKQNNPFSAFPMPILLSGHDIRTLSLDNLNNLIKHCQISPELVDNLKMALVDLGNKAYQLGSIDLARLNTDWSKNDIDVILQTRLPQFSNYLNEIIPPEHLLELSEFYHEISEVLWKLYPNEYDGETVKSLLGAQVAEIITMSDFSKPTEFILPEKREGSGKSIPYIVIDKLQNKLDSILNNKEKEEFFRKAVQLAVAMLKKEHYGSFCEDRKECLKTIIREIKDSQQQPIKKAGLTEALKYFKGLSLYEKRIKGIRSGSKLWPFQVEAVRRISMQQHAILADEMGAGKTIESLASAINLGAKSIFIVCPDSAKQAWVRDLYKFIENPKRNKKKNAKIKITLLGAHNYKDMSKIIPEIVESYGARKDIKFECIYGGENIKAYLENYPQTREKNKDTPHFVIINYENLIERNGDPDEYGITSKMRMLAEINPDFLAVDEAHAIKNITTAQSKHVRSINARHKVLITGTPLENQAEDLFAYLNFIAPYTFPSLKEFEEKYSGDDLSKMGKLFQILKKVIIRRKKEDVLHGLPVKRQHNVYINQDSGEMAWNGEKIQLDNENNLSNVEAQKAVYQYILNNFIEFETEYQKRKNENDSSDSNGAEDKENIVYSTKITRLRQAIDDPGILGFTEIDSVKYLALDRILDEKISKGEKVVIFSPYKTITKKLSARYAKYGVAYMDGEVSKPKRIDQINTFQDQEDKKVFIATLGTGGQSITLTAAATVIFFDKPLKPSMVDQAIDRIHRIDTKRNQGRGHIDIINLIVDGEKSIDIALENLLKKKRIITDIIIDGLFTPELKEALRKIGDKIFKRFMEDAEKSVPAGDRNRRPELTEPQKVFLTAINKGWDAAAEGYAREVKNFASFWIDWFKARWLISYFAANNASKFPELILFEGSGPSVAMRAWLELKPVLDKFKFSLPIGVDLDSSKNMLRYGISPHRIAGDMVYPPLDNEKFDLIDNGSLHLVPQSKRTKTLAEAHRMLKDGGLLTVSTTVQGDRIGEKFIKGLKMLGFDILDRVNLEPDYVTFQALKESYGIEIAQRIKEKMRGEEMVLVAKSRPLNENVPWQMFSFGNQSDNSAKRDFPVNRSSDNDQIDLKNVDLTKFADPILETNASKKIVYKSDLSKLSKGELISELKDKLGSIGLELEGKKEKQDFIDIANRFLAEHESLSWKEKEAIINSLEKLSRRLFPVSDDILSKYKNVNVDSIPEDELKDMGLVKEKSKARGHEITRLTPMLAYYFRKLLKELQGK